MYVCVVMYVVCVYVSLLLCMICIIITRYLPEGTVRRFEDIIAYHGDLRKRNVPEPAPMAPRGVVCKIHVT